MNTRDVKRRIREHLGYWVPRLGLSGRTVTVHWCRVLSGKQKEEAGSCRWDALSGDVVLTFNAGGMTAKGYSDRDVEEVVVHELVHAVACGGSERATNTLSHALVEQRRRPPHPWEEASQSHEGG